MTIAIRTEGQQVAAPASGRDHHHADLRRLAASQNRQGRVFFLAWAALLIGGLVFVLVTVFA